MWKSNDWDFHETNLNPRERKKKIAKENTKKKTKKMSQNNMKHTVNLESQWVIWVQCVCKQATQTNLLYIDLVWKQRPFNFTYKQILIHFRSEQRKLTITIHEYLKLAYQSYQAIMINSYVQNSQGKTK